MSSSAEGFQSTYHLGDFGCSVFGSVCVCFADFSQFCSNLFCFFGVEGECGKGDGCFVDCLCLHGLLFATSLKWTNSD